MKSLVRSVVNMIVLIIIISLPIACEKNSGTSATELKIISWGPTSMALGNIPNKQPNGNIGVWIEVSGAGSLGKAKALFGSFETDATVSEKVITFGVPAEQLTKTGEKEITIKQISTGKTFYVGKFIIRSAK